MRHTHKGTYLVTASRNRSKLYTALLPMDVLGKPGGKRMAKVTHFPARDAVACRQRVIERLGNVGSGTAVMAAQELLRVGIGLDISRPYLEEQAKLRTGAAPKLEVEGLPLFEMEHA